MEKTSDFNPRIHIVELAPHGFRYYRGLCNSLDEAPPRYTWQRIDCRVDDIVVYVDLTDSKIKLPPSYN